MADAGGANVVRLNLYQDYMSTDAANKYGSVVNEERENFNALATILNGAWSSWTPTVTYFPTALSNVGCTTSTTEVAKYKQIGSTVLFRYQCIAGPQSAANITIVTVSLPVTPKDDDVYPIVNCLEMGSRATADYFDPQGYIDMTTSTAAQRLIRFRKWINKIGTDSYALYVNGMYEVA
jgi:hypothetical protein